jgi:uncharacterized protein YacL
VAFFINLNYMKNLIRLCKHPFGIYGVLVMIFLAFCFVGIPLLSIGYPDGEQISLTMLGHGMSGLVFGLVIWSIASPIIFWSWYKQRKFIPLILPVIIALLLIYMLITIYLQNNNYLAI